MAECSGAPEIEIGAGPAAPPMPRRLGYVVLALLVLGVGLRVWAYVHNPALRLDEAAFALDLQAHPVAFGLEAQGRMKLYPLAFVAATKVAVSAFGNVEHVLRLIPFLGSLAALGLFYALARRCLRPNALAIAVCVFAVSPRLALYAAEAKPFSSDVAVVTGLALLTSAVLSGPLTVGLAVAFAAAGAVAVWFSYSAAFCLAGFGTVMGIRALAKRQWGRAAGLCAVGLTWATSLGVYYWLGLREVSRLPKLTEYWRSEFVPLPPTSWSDVKWFWDDGLDIFHDPVGLALPPLAALVFCVGFISLARRRGALAFALVAPMVVMLLVSGLHLYPYAGRMLLFCVPLLCLPIAEGAERIRGALSAKARVAGVLFMLVLLVPPCARGLRAAVSRMTEEEIRPVLAYVAAHREEGDTVFVYRRASTAAHYYAPRYGLSDVAPIRGSSTTHNWARCVADLEELRGRKRVWFIFSHLRRSDRHRFRDHLDGMGTRLLEVEAPGASGYLYNLSEAAPSDASRD